MKDACLNCGGDLPPGNGTEDADFKMYCSECINESFINGDG